MNTGTTTAVIFLRARRSSVDGGLDLIDVQRAQCMALADHLNAAVIREYVEYCGMAMLDKRPQLKLMLDELRALRDVDYVIAVDADRLVRRLNDWTAIDLELTASGAKLVTVSSGEALPIMKV